MKSGLRKLVAILALSVSSLLSIDESIAFFIHSQEHGIEFQTNSSFLSHIHTQIPDHFIQKCLHQVDSGQDDLSQSCTFGNDPMILDFFIDNIWQPPKGIL